MKLCIHCQHFTVPPNHTPESGLCGALEAPRSLVTGEMLYPHQFASAHRINGCGKEAKFYVERATSEEEEAFTNLENKHDDSSKRV